MSGQHQQYSWPAKLTWPPQAAAAEMPHVGILAGIVGDTEAFTKSFCVVGIAEVFDKTWFVALMLALKFGPRLAFASSFSALAIHSAISALLGFGMANMLKPSSLDLLTAAIFGLFAILYFKDFWYADPDGDMIQAGKEEADECIEAPMESEEAHQTYGIAEGKGDIGKGVRKAGSWSKAFQANFHTFLSGFVTVFIAEWGDRTQIAMIGLHSSMPIVPVFFGSVLAFFVVSLSAVLVAAALDKTKLNEKLVMGLVSVSFALFCAMSLRDGIIARRAGS